MKFYLWTLSLYSLIATVLVVMLAIQNRELKQGGPGGTPQTIDYKTVVTIPDQESPVRGEASAPITVTVFSEFECPFCARSNQVVEDVMRKHPGKIRFVYKHFPLPRHANAKPAAAAAMAAGEQGKFWEMHDLLYLLQENLNEDEYVNAAASLNLDMEKFEADRSLERWEAVIDADKQLGLELGVSGTPTFFVNGVRLPSFSFLEEAVDHFLESGT